MGCRGGLFYKGIDKTHMHPKRDLQQRCLLQRLSKTQAGPDQALFAKQPLLSWPTRSRTENISNLVARRECTHIKRSQCIKCTLVLSGVQLRDEVSLIVVLSNELFAIFGRIRRPSIRANLGTRRKIADYRGMVSLPRTDACSNSSTDHIGKVSLSPFGPLSRRCRGDPSTRTRDPLPRRFPH